ncbi:hypothetical protein GCM10022271_15770 [Corallibacter vietnamensis]|uniref:Uncharacterized protein n=1 Tax=Corallibacter vietnamensis TaxID=904130 RepID=A0ABP7H5L5_9FLAO
MKRICIYPSDVEAITGKSKKTAQTLVRTIKDVYQKKKHQVVTIREFCDYMGLEYDDVFNEINKKRTA